METARAETASGTGTFSMERGRAAMRSDSSGLQAAVFRSSVIGAVIRSPNDDLGLVVGTKYDIDLNGNGVWNGNAGGDRVTDFKFGGVGTPVAGKWLPR
jgi:hypothetical protein